MPRLVVARPNVVLAAFAAIVIACGVSLAGCDSSKDTASSSSTSSSGGASSGGPGAGGISTPQACELRDDTCSGACIEGVCKPSDGLTLGTEECTVAGLIDGTTLGGCLARYSRKTVHLLVFDSDFSSPKVFDANSPFIADEGGIHLGLSAADLLSSGTFAVNSGPTQSVSVEYVDAKDVAAESVGGTVKVSGGSLAFYAESGDTNTADDGKIGATLDLDLKITMPDSPTPKILKGTIMVNAAKGSGSGGSPSASGSCTDIRSGVCSELKQGNTDDYKRSCDGDTDNSVRYSSQSCPKSGWSYVCKGAKATNNVTGDTITIDIHWPTNYCSNNPTQDIGGTCGKLKGNGEGTPCTKP